MHPEAAIGYRPKDAIVWVIKHKLSRKEVVVQRGILL
jgi:hypothetical protein